MPAETTPTDDAPSIESLLKKVIALQATDLYIKAGKPPLVRVNGRVRRLNTKVLDALDTAALMRSITPENVQREVQETGQEEFTLDFQECRFRVAVFTEHGHLGLKIRWAVTLPDPAGDS
jgi:twitching motility protein PilT